MSILRMAVSPCWIQGSKAILWATSCLVTLVSAKVKDLDGFDLVILFEGVENTTGVLLDPS